MAVRSEVQRVHKYNDVASHLVYVLDSTDVQTTVVAGNILMQNRKVLTIDESKLRADVSKNSAEIRAALQGPQEP